MDKLKDLCAYELDVKLSAVESLLESARDCWSEGNWIQCAVRLEMITPIKFDDFVMKILEEMSNKGKDG